MAQSVPLKVRISAELGDIKQGLAMLRGDLAKVKTEAARSGPDTAKWSAGLKSARREVLGFVAAIASIRTVRMFASLSDEATQLRGRIRAASGDYQRLLALAQETRTGMVGTVDLYARMERATRAQGVGQERLLAITKTVNQAVKLSYADAGTAEAALTQFAQGLAAGALRGQDLNSVLSGTPVLAEAIAKGMGKPVAEIKKLGEAGKLTTTAVLAALENQAKAVDEEFAKVPVTISDALTQVRNSFLDYVGNQNEATGATQAFASLLQDVAANLPKLFEPLLEATASLAQHLTGAATAADGASTAMKKGGSSAQFMAGAGEFLGNVFRIIASAGIVVKNVVESITVAVAAMADVVMTVYSSVFGGLGRMMGSIAGFWRVLSEQGPVAAMQAWKESAADVAKDFTDLPGKVSSKLAIAKEMIGENLAELVNGVQAAFGKVDALSRQATPAAAGGGGVVDPATDPLGGARVATSLAMHRDTIARALAELDRLYKDNEVSIREYFETRLQLQQQEIDSRLIELRAEAASAKDASARRKSEEEIVKLMRDRAQLATVAAREQAAAENDLAEKLGDVKLALMELDGRTADVARARLEAQYMGMLKRLEKESDTTGQAMVRNLIDRLTSKAQLDQFSARMQEVTGRLSGGESSLSAQMEVGAIGIGEGERQLNSLRATSLEQLRQLRIEAAAYLATLAGDSPEAAKAMQFVGELDATIARVIATQREFSMAVEDAAAGALGTFFNDLISGTKSFSEAVRDMARNFAQAIAQMIARTMALKAAQAFMNMWGGGGASAGVAHTGGIAGAFSSYRHNVNPMLFGMAPRYHSGGIAGLAPDEVPAILRRGEEVLTAGDPRHRFNGGAGGGGGAGRVTTPIVAIGDAAIADALAGAAGENIVLTHVRNNWGGLSRG